MAHSVRYQVFLSSTYTDLKEERAEVLQALWEMDCIPTGMEAFVASNEDQWQVIKRVIEECDYYVLIIGGRYGTVTDEGVSYTEKEYRYAKKLGIPVLAFVHAEPESIAVGKTEKEDEGRRKLSAFREAVMNAHPVRAWKTAQELGGLVSRSLGRESRINPRPGWVRNDGAVSTLELLEKVAQLTADNQTLRMEASERREAGGSHYDEGLSSGGDIFKITGTRSLTKDGTYDRYNETWHLETTWDNLFKRLGPILLNEAAEEALKNSLNALGYRGVAKGYRLNSASISNESFAELLIQFRALGFIDRGNKKRGVNDHHSYWRITERGDRHLVSLLAKRKIEVEGADQDEEAF